MNNDIALGYSKSAPDNTFKKFIIEHFSRYVFDNMGNEILNEKDSMLIHDFGSPRKVAVKDMKPSSIENSDISHDQPVFYIKNEGIHNTVEQEKIVYRSFN